MAASFFVQKGALRVAPKPRSIIYVDGFNLYYGAVKNTPHKWLDLQRYFSLIRQNDDIQLIRYFTAPIVGPTRPNQDTFLLALATLPLVAVTLGAFKSRSIRCEVPGCGAVLAEAVNRNHHFFQQAAVKFIRKVAGKVFNGGVSRDRKSVV